MNRKTARYVRLPPTQTRCGYDSASRKIRQTPAYENRTRDNTARNVLASLADTNQKEPSVPFFFGRARPGVPYTNRARERGIPDMRKRPTPERVRRFALDD